MYLQLVITDSLVLNSFAISKRLFCRSEPFIELVEQLLHDNDLPLQTFKLRGLVPGDLPTSAQMAVQLFYILLIQFLVKRSATEVMSGQLLIEPWLDGSCLRVKSLC